MVFQEVPAVKKPGRARRPEAWASYQEARKKHNLSVAAVAQFEKMRAEFDARGLQNTFLLHTVDASYMNHTTLAFSFERSVVAGRVRKNAKLCYPAPEGGRRVYGTDKFTPESVAHDKRRKWKKATIFHGGKFREVRYKEVKKVLWQGGGRRRLLRLRLCQKTCVNGGFSLFSWGMDMVSQVGRPSTGCAWLTCLAPKWQPGAEALRA